MSSVANLSREELLKREKELKDVLRGSKLAPQKQIRLIQPIHRTASTVTHHTFFKSTVPPKRQSNVPPVHQSINRVFVRKSIANSRTNSVIVPPGLPSSESLLNEPYFGPSFPSSAGSQDSLELWESKDKWNRSLMLSVGDSSDEEDTEDFRIHQQALKQILHPAKPVPKAKKEDVLFRSATKIVKETRKSPPNKIALLAESQAMLPPNATNKPINNSKNRRSAHKFSSESSQFKFTKFNSENQRPVDNNIHKASSRNTPRKLNSFNEFKRNRYKMLKRLPSKNTHKKLKQISSDTAQRLLMLRGVPFRSSQGGRVLKRINTSLKTKLGARSIQAGKILAKLRPQNGKTVLNKLASQLVNRSVYKLNMKSNPNELSKTKDCIFYVRFGKCHNGSTCKYTHDPKKVSICTKFLRGTCKADKCPFSHKVDKDKMPLCSYFMQGQCSMKNCPYRHSYFRKDIPYCPDFLKGFCEKGQMCTKQHLLVCAKTDCSRDPKKCPLYHKKKNCLKKKPKTKKAIIASKDLAEAWPEFVTLSGSDDDEVEVHVEMPARTSNKLQRFLERRSKPVWPDHSPGVSAKPVELKEYSKIGQKVRATMKRARWLRRVRPIQIPGEVIFLEKMPAYGSDSSGSDSLDSCGSSDEDEEFEFPLKCVEPTVTYGDALNRKRGESVMSDMTSELSDGVNSVKDQDDEWLLDYLDEQPSPERVVEPQRLEYFGPVFEHWEFRTGDKIREILGKFKRTISLQILNTSDFIPLRDQEEGEILSDESDEELRDDLDVVDMDLASDGELDASKSAQSGNGAQTEKKMFKGTKKRAKKRAQKKRKKKQKKKKKLLVEETESLQDSFVVSDLEEGEIV